MAQRRRPYLLAASIAALAKVQREETRSSVWGYGYFPSSPSCESHSNPETCPEKFMSRIVKLYYCRISYNVALTARFVKLYYLERWARLALTD
jgi:hypothetical protein